MGMFGLENVKGLGFLNKVNLQYFAAGVGRIILAILIFALIGGVIFFILWRKKNKRVYDKKIFWFEEVHGEIIPIGEDLACELVIPNTSITVFYIRSKDLYLPRPIKKMGKDAYWFAIRNNREIVNFKPKNLNLEMHEANLDYDHTDMRYAWVNLRELIKRNFRDNAIPWWREYKDVIGLVVLIFVLTMSFLFIISKIGSLADKLGLLIDRADQLVKAAEMTQGSGVVQG